MLLPMRIIAEHFHRSPRTIRIWIANGKFPKPVLLPSGQQAWDASVLRHEATGAADVPATSSTPIT